MRVLFLIGTPQIGGTEVQLATLARLLSGHGCETRIHIMASGAGPLTDLLDSSGVRWTSCPSHSFESLQDHRSLNVRRLAAIVNHRRRSSSIQEVVKAFSPNLVHGFLPGCIAYGLPVVQDSDRRAVTVAGIRGSTPCSPPTSRLRRVPQAERMRRSLAACNAVVVNSPHLVESETDGFGVPREKVHVIPNGVLVPSERCVPDREPPTAVVVANFHSYKGHATLVEAVAKSKANVRVRLCGIGPEANAIDRMIRTLGVTDRIVIVPAPADIPGELRSAQFAIHPSYTEGLSNAILEEIAAGLPVIATEVGGAALQIEHMVSGWLVPPKDVAALASAIEQLTEDPALRVSLGMQARKRAKQFSWDACAQAHMRLYEELIGA